MNQLGTVLLLGILSAILAIPARMQPATASLVIVNPFSAAEGVLTLFSTHPSMRERIRRLREVQVQPGGWPVGARDATLDARW